MKYLKDVHNSHEISEDKTMLTEVKCCNDAKWIYRAYQVFCY